MGVGGGQQGRTFTSTRTLLALLCLSTALVRQGVGVRGGATGEDLHLRQDLVGLALSLHNTGKAGGGGGGGGATGEDLHLHQDLVGLALSLHSTGEAGGGGEGGGQQGRTFTSARTLLALLHLSTALVRQRVGVRGGGEGQQGRTFTS